jgi:hypothetical protein
MPLSECSLAGGSTRQQRLSSFQWAHPPMTTLREAREHKPSLPLCLPCRPGRTCAACRRRSRPGLPPPTVGRLLLLPLAVVLPKPAAVPAAAAGVRRRLRQPLQRQALLARRICSGSWRSASSRTRWVPPVVTAVEMGADKHQCPQFFLLGSSSCSAEKLASRSQPGACTTSLLFPASPPARLPAPPTAPAAPGCHPEQRAQRRRGASHGQRLRQLPGH